jgi:hypothetical protein
VPVIVGGVRDEGKLFFDTQTGMTTGQYEYAIDAQYESIAAAALAPLPGAQLPGAVLRPGGG